ncbi:MAG TPA: hypothetical protein VGA69_06060 [Nitriliruptorales bacterium]
MDVVDWGDVEPVAVGQMESRTAQLGVMVVTRHVIPAGFDSTPFYRGLPNDMCPCEHWCLLVRGQMRYRYVDGRTQTVEAGQVFRVAPGHLADVLEDSELIEFTDAEDYARKAAHLADAAERG